MKEQVCQKVAIPQSVSLFRDGRTFLRSHVIVVGSRVLGSKTNQFIAASLVQSEVDFYVEAEMVTGDYVYVQYNHFSGSSQTLAQYARFGMRRIP